MLVVSKEKPGMARCSIKERSVDWMNLLMEHNPSAVRLPPSESAILSEVQP